MSGLVIPILVFVAVAMATAIFVAFWIRISLRAKILDVPTHRSSHVRTTPRGGGVGIVAGVLGGMTAIAAFGTIDRDLVLWFCLLSAVVAGVSFVDDVHSLPSLVRLLVHVGVAGATVKCVGAIGSVSIPFLGEWSGPTWWSYFVTVAWLVGLTNVYNFMDGIDGIAGGQGVVAGLAWAGWGCYADNDFVFWLGLVLAAACVGFLRFNWSPARVFMGDVGSAFLGFSFGLLPILAVRAIPGPGMARGSSAGAVPIIAGLVLWPFLADGIFTFFRRAANRENVLAAHRSHLYQRLTIAGWSHAAVARLYVAWALLTAVLGVVFLVGDSFVRTTVALTAIATVVAVHGLVCRVERVPVVPGVRTRNERSEPAVRRSPTPTVPETQDKP